jgi:phosphatidylinositol alpha-mannosyltransferase
VLLEAMALGVAVLATDLPGHRSVVTPDHDGVLVPRRDSGALAAALARLLDDPVERRRLGANGLRSAAGFGWSEIAERLEAIYRSVVVPAAPPARGAAAPDEALVSAGA